MQLFAKRLTIRIVGECLLTLVLIVLALNFSRITKGPFIRGFFCDDESLKYPYREDTINGFMLFALSLYLPIFIMVTCEGLQLLVIRRHTSIAEERGLLTALLKLHHNIMPFLCGFALHACFVHLGKITVGRLRPHFFDVCKPNFAEYGGTCDNHKYEGIYIDRYECNNPSSNKYMLANVHLSFPSGHSSYMFYGMIYTILYLQRFSKTLCQRRINIGILMMIVQMLCALLAWFVALSRVTDYKHHWSDVLVGIILGTSVAIAVSQYVCQQLKSVNGWPEGVKTSSSSSTSNTESSGSSTTTFSTNMTNKILVP